MPETAETVAAAIEALQSRPKSEKKYAVMERGYNRERQIFESDDREAAQTVADQHPARRVVLNK